MTITLRNAKGSALTYSELDGNFQDLDARTDYGWSDLVQQVIVQTGAPNAPTIQNFRNGLYFYAFAPATNNEVYVCFHLNHDYAPTGGDTGYEGMVYPHVHWATNTTSTGVVRWGVEWTAARRDDSTGTTVFGATNTLYIEHTVGPGEQYQHQVNESATGSGIPHGGILETDALILCRYFRDATHPNDTFPDDVFLLTVDLHYPAFQSQSPLRVPPFF
jgi:hypothetical protein